jgi:hypothetical protein
MTVQQEAGPYPDRTGSRVISKRVAGGTYHGHVRTWDELEEPMKRVLVQYGVVDARGRMTIDPSRWNDEP